MGQGELAVAMQGLVKLEVSDHPFATKTIFDGGNSFDMCEYKSRQVGGRKSVLLLVTADWRSFVSEASTAAALTALPRGDLGIFSPYLDNSIPEHFFDENRHNYY